LMSFVHGNRRVMGVAAGGIRERLT
jgi:hypothetical protein